MVGRGIQIQYHLRACSHGLRGRLRRPDVFTDGHADLQTVQFKNSGLSARREIAHFVEHPVVGEAMLAVKRFDFTVSQQGCAVIEFAVGVQGQAHQQGDICALGRKRLQRLVDPDFQAGAQQQVFRRVARQRQFRKHHQPGAAGGRLTRRLLNPLRIAGNIADHRIDLRHGYGYISAHVCSTLTVK